MKISDVGAVVLRGITAEGFSCSFEQLCFPLNDGVGMNVETFGEFGDGLITFDGSDCHLSLEG